MIKFVKTKDDGNEFDNFEVEYTVSNDISHDELTEIYFYFLRACGYAVDREDINLEE